MSGATPIELALVPVNFHLTNVPTVISVLILDGSGSMKDFTAVVKSAVKEYLDSLREDKTKRYIVGIIVFSNHWEVMRSLADVDQVTDIDEYRPDGRTQLWNTVIDVLFKMMTLVKLQSKIALEQTTVLIHVFSDGLDNLSGFDAMKHLQVYSLQALHMGFDLFTYGIGIDAPDLARMMGFPDDEVHAKTFGRSEADIQESVIEMTQTTRGLGYRPRKVDSGSFST